MPYVVDADGERKIIRVKGYDHSDPEAIYEGYIEIRPGGMQVFKARDSRPITISPPVEVPTSEEIREARDQRAAEYVEKERAATEQEHAAEQAKQAALAKKREDRKQAREAAEKDAPTAA